MDLTERKNALRERLRVARSGLAPGRAAALGARAAEQLAALPEFVRAGRVALFASLPDEIDTRPLFDRAREAGKACLFPRSLPGDRLAFALVDDWDELVPGRYGVLEPPERDIAAPLGAGDLAVLPGVAFDRRGRRLGRGRGFYDRTFAEVAGPVLVGFAAAFQVVDEVPAGPTDRPVDAIVTEVGVLWIEPGSGGGADAGRARGASTDDPGEPG
ncbi:MAG: 5-formyltetrahydrofolate cyclo-ligase [Myxococcota bacterium]